MKQLLEGAKVLKSHATAAGESDGMGSDSEQGELRLQLVMKVDQNEIGCPQFDIRMNVPSMDCR